MKYLRFMAVAVILLVAAGLLLSSFLRNTSGELGVCLHLSDFNVETEAALVDLGVRWVRIDWIIGEMGDFMEKMSNNDIGVLAILDHNTMNQQNFTLVDWQGNISAIMASDEAKLVKAWEIWNEPNAPQFYLGYMDGTPEHYLDMLRIAYNTIKSTSDVPIVCAGLFPNATTWPAFLKNLYELEVEDYCDMQGVHLYADWAMANLEIMNSVKAYGKPVWVTEIGRPSSSENFTEVGQALYLNSNLRFLLPNVEKVFWYELVDNVNVDLTNLKENYFGLINANYMRKIAFENFRVIINR